MQACLKTGSKSQQMAVVKEVIRHLQEFLNDEFANYVVSEVINFRDPKINLHIAKVVCSNLADYANSKYSSGVIENLLLNSDH